jgi:multidrug resistance efflux pump
MFTNYALSGFAALGVIFAGFTIYHERQPQPIAKPYTAPPRHPRDVKVICGPGLIEAQRKNVPIAVNVAGVVTEIFVNEGDMVATGAALFRVDDRDLQAQLRVREAELSASLAQLHKLTAGPRPEDIPPAQAAVETARAKLKDAESSLARTARLFSRQMVAPSDFDKEHYSVAAAEAALAQSKAELDRVVAGSWQEDIAVAKAQVELARAQVECIKSALERLTVKAPIDGQILQVNVRLGQFAALAWKEPMMVMGDVTHLHVRVDIDESDLPLFAQHAQAVATLKSRPQVRFPLDFVSVQPYVIPKQNLTGYGSERVDTRVLQVIYRLPDDRPIATYVGQQMDVYIRAAEPPWGMTLELQIPGSIPFQG